MALVTARRKSVDYVQLYVTKAAFSCDIGGFVKRSKYPVVLHANIEDGGYWVECRTLPGCASQGDTIEEAFEMIKDAIEGHLEIMAEDEREAKARQTR